MKNILFILSFICISCKAQQQVISIGTKGFHIEGAYYKDVSNDLDPYVGTWKGTFENKTFTITFHYCPIKIEFLFLKQSTR